MCLRMIHSIISSCKKEIIYITDCLLKNFSCSLVAAERAVYESKLSKTNRNENDPSYIFKSSNVNKYGVNSLKAAKLKWKEDFDRARFAITSLFKRDTLFFFSRHPLLPFKLCKLMLWLKFFFSSSVGEGGGSIVAKRIQRWHSRESTGT